MSAGCFKPPVKTVVTITKSEVSARVSVMRNQAWGCGKNQVRYDPYGLTYTCAF